MNQTIYLTAQPDNIYFLWQLELQLRNLNDLGVAKKNINVLIAYDPIVGENANLEEFRRQNDHLACIYTYSDTRSEKKYASSIRPHIIHKHFLTNPSLEKEAIFYIDSDVLFSRIPEIYHTPDNDTCYVSDTRSYLDTKYIKHVSSEILLQSMVDIVGIKVATLYANDNHVGGAQYLLRNLPAMFWEKVEKDSEALFNHMSTFNDDLWDKNYQNTKSFKSNHSGIQTWCADMWSLLWNLYYFQKKVEIHTELNFSWASNPIADWKTNSILHYTGNKDNSKVFNKTKYFHNMPWYDSLDHVSSQNCSYQVVLAIKKRRKELDSKRKRLGQTNIILIINKKSERLLAIQSSYILKNYDCRIKACSIETDENGNAKISTSFLETLEQKEIASSYLIYRVEYLLEKHTLQHILEENQNNLEDKICFQTTHNYEIDSIFEQYFPEFLDDQLLKLNLGKFEKVNCESPEIFIVKRDILKQALADSGLIYPKFIESLQRDAHVSTFSNSFNLFKFKNN
ncbi:hypothetical protein [Pedobacter caeni]|uniref:Uncharacterized protein n=1 Tax=Pedobacter caeni TaxID=288992 RepID=A0A1M5EES4_9SPHI|nr:hypothetical protein [Pedobacter caeni]SHF77660.1 hypothetical protein SAMN04488522_103619 [Pedobacter caeni]